jgi:L-amino acid N-acyltransferase YncA
MTVLRKATHDDWPAMWQIFREVVRSEDTYVFAPETLESDAWAYWFGSGVSSFVAISGQEIMGMYKLVANYRDLGSHVANASFMVSTRVRGKGIGREMGLAALEEAKARGFLAMQFNFVVSTNAAAVSLWKSLGFEIVGTLPKVFRHRQLGLVDAYVMHRFL